MAKSIFSKKQNSYARPSFLFHTSAATPKDYISLLKPRVMVLVIFTALISMLLAPGTLHPYLKFLAIFSIALGAGAAGCLNMWYEKSTDALMARTKNRPLPSGLISPSDALAMGISLSFIAIILLGLSTTPQAAFWLAVTIVFYAVIYTMLLKPLTSQNIVFGGTAGALPPVVAWQAVDPGWHLFPWLLFTIIFLWTPAHFWALSLHLPKDYQRANIPILPNTHGKKFTYRCIFAYTLLTATSSFLPVYFLYLDQFYAFSALFLGCFFIISSWLLLKEKIEPLRFFIFTIFYLFALFLSMAIDNIF